MRIVVADRESVEAGLNLKVGHVVISIRDPDRKPARIKRLPGLREVLVVTFDDAEPCKTLELPPAIRLMTEADAKAIWAFVAKHRDSVPALVVHCEMGMSRSPAVAAAVTRALGEDDARFFADYMPNRYVYELMLRVGGVP